MFHHVRCALVAAAVLVGIGSARVDPAAASQVEEENLGGIRGGESNDRELKKKRMGMGGTDKDKKSPKGGGKSSKGKSAKGMGKSSKGKPVPPPPIGELDKTILSCSIMSQPTFCEAPEASIDCLTLQTRMNECTALAGPEEYIVYDPSNCGDGPDPKPLPGCNQGGMEYCRLCGVNQKNGIQPCATGFYGPYYEPFGNGQPAAQANERQGEQTVSDILGIPVRVDCNKYYDILESFQLGPVVDSLEDIGQCALDAYAFETYSYFANDGDTTRIAECPPQLSGAFMAYENNARYQLSTTVNAYGQVFPQKKDPALAVGPVPAELPTTEFSEKCGSLALGQETNIFDAGEVSTMALTAKTMAARMLRPAVFQTNGISNCCEIVDDGTDSDCTVCDSYSFTSIDDPTNWVNASGNNTGFYVYPNPSAARPYETSDLGQRTRRVAKQMHGKGQACIYAKFSFSPLKELYMKNLKEGAFGYIPPVRRVGLLDEKLAMNDITFDTMVRLAGNKNITNMKDVHDIRIRGFALKLFGVDEAFKKLGIPFNQIFLPYVPPYNQPENAKYTFGEYNFDPNQELGNLDLLHVAIGNGNLLGTDPPVDLNGVAFDPTTEKGSRNPPDNVFVASNVDNYYNGFILGGSPDITVSSITDVYQNPLSYTYGSSSPLRAGPGASLKLSWAACPGEQSKIKNVYDSLEEAFKDANFFSTNLKETVEESEIKFCGYIQFQENPCTEPLEDPITRWLTDNIKVFELTFPKQNVPDYNTFCDNTVYTPWRTIQEHQPQGFINRMRGGVYMYAHNYRLILNNGVQKVQDGDKVVDTRGQNACPYGFDSEPRYEPIPVGTRPPYQGQPVQALTQTLDIDTEGNIPDPDPSSAAGPCINDEQCQLPYGPTSKCQNPGFPSGTCKPTNDGLFE